MPRARAAAAVRARLRVAGPHWLLGHARCCRGLGRAAAAARSAAAAAAAPTRRALLGRARAGPRTRSRLLGRARAGAAGLRPSRCGPRM